MFLCFPHTEPPEMPCLSWKSGKGWLYSFAGLVFQFTSTIVTMAQETFLSNHTNKRNFITILIGEMTTKGIAVKQATEYAEGISIHTAISKAVVYDKIFMTDFFI